jgi:hypothetical protein
VIEAIVATLAHGLGPAQIRPDHGSNYRSPKFALPCGEVLCSDLQHEF